MTDISSISKRTCDSCAKPLPNGELFYHCRTEIVAGKDEHLPDVHNPDKIIAQALIEIEAGREEQDLLDDIYQELILVLCPDCRVKLLQQIGSMLKSSGCEGCAKCGPTPSKKKGKVLQFPEKSDSTK
ncbi:MAG: hypothetical protein ABFS19_07435 [Thermodesulfobacteriota bacterium]